MIFERLLFCTVFILFASSFANGQFEEVFVNANNTFDIGQFLNQYSIPLQMLQTYLQQNAHLFSLQRLNISDRCMNKTVQFINSLQKQEDWSIQVVDSWGKPPSGIFNGGVNWIGEYAMCLNITEYSKTWKSKYCVIEKPAQPSLLSPKLKYGICVSDDCDKTDIAQLINFGLDYIIAFTKLQTNNDYDYGYSEDETTKAPINLPIQIERINEEYIDCKEPRKFLPSAIIVLCILSVILLVILIASVYDLIHTYLGKREREKQIVTGSLEKGTIGNGIESKNTFIEVMKGLSVVNGVKKVMEIPNNYSDQFGCIHAIRVLSISWVVYGHTYMVCLNVANNMRVAFEWTKLFIFLAIFNATYVVDTFFFMSGFLLSYIFMRQVEKQNSKITPLFMFKYYVHRLWRITPAYMIVVFTSAYLSMHLGNGPFFGPNGFEQKGCRSSIWTNVLYINNFFNSQNMCLGVSWYVANDMQFHWVAPLILIPLALKKEFMGFILCIVFLIATVLTNALIINANPGFELAGFNLDPTINIRQFEEIYIKPWCRIGPFVIGIMLGYIVYQQKKNHKFPKIDFKLNFIGWIVSLTLMGMMIFGIHGDFVGNPLSRPAHIMYQTFSRIVWSIGVAYITYACITSNGGIVNKLLSQPFWIVLSRLSYGVYLVHMPVSFFFIYRMQHPIYLQHDTVFCLFLGYLGTSFIFSFLLNIFVEAPFIALERFIFGKN